MYKFKILVVGNLLFAHLFAKLFWPGDSEETFWVFASSYYLFNPSKVEYFAKDSTSKLPIPLMLNVKKGSCAYRLNFLNLVETQQGN